MGSRLGTDQPGDLSRMLRLGGISSAGRHCSTVMAAGQSGWGSRPWESSLDGVHKYKYKNKNEYEYEFNEININIKNTIYLYMYKCIHTHR